MGRVARAIAAALILGLLAAYAAAEPPSGKGPGRTPSKPGGSYRLGEVRITGAAELPGVLFFLPRAPVELRPLRPERDPEEVFLAEDRTSEATRR